MSTGLVVADERPDLVAAVAAKHGAKPADSVEELLASGVDGVVVSAATPAHAELTLAAVATRPADVLREAHRRDRRGERQGRRGDRPLRRAGAGRLPAAVRRRVRRRQARGRRRVAGPAAHRAQHHDGSRSPADGVHRGFRRHLPRLRRARFRRAALDHRAAGRRGVRHRQRAGRSAVHRVRRCRHRRRGGDVRSGHPRVWCRRPDTTAAATTADWRCTASTTPWSPAGTRAHRCGTSTRTTSFPAGPAHHFFMDRFTDAFRAELARSSTWSTAAPLPRARWPTRSRSPGWRRRRPSRCSAGVPVRIEEVRSHETERLPAHRSPGACARCPDGAISSRPQRVLAEMRDVGTGRNRTRDPRLPAVRSRAS